MSINHVTISGNITRDPELKVLDSGMAILRFGMAVNDRRKNQQGEWADYPNFIDCAMFGKRAEAISPYLEKGAKVCASGKLHYSSWEHEGQKHSKLEVYIDEIEFMSARKSNSVPCPPNIAAQARSALRPENMQFEEVPAPNQTADYVAPQSAYDDDIPF